MKRFFDLRCYGLLLIVGVSAFASSWAQTMPNPLLRSLFGQVHYGVESKRMSLGIEQNENKALGRCPRQRIFCGWHLWRLILETMRRQSNC